MSNKSAHLIIVTDCSGSDEARYGIAAHRCFHPERVDIDFFPVESMNTFHAGFTAAAHALSTVDHFGPLKDGERIGILVNAAPRHGTENGRKLRGGDRKTEGEEIYALRLRNRVWVVGPNAGWNLYFFKGQIEASHLVTNKSGLDTPFRSMEFMVPTLAKVLGVNDFPEIELSWQIPTFQEDVQGTWVADWDSHGNIYLFSTLPNKAWLPKVGEYVTVNIGGKIGRLRHVEGIFAGNTGEQTITPGSLSLNGKAIHYIVIVGGSAHSLFGNPAVGTVVKIEED